MALTVEAMALTVVGTGEPLSCALGNPWPVWCTNVAQGNFTCSVWQTWNTGVVSNCTDAVMQTAAAWTTWNASYVNVGHGTPSLTEEQIAQRDAALAKFAEQKAEADAKAEELLNSHLSLRQRRSYRKRREFLAEARDGTRFRIKKGWSGNVEELDASGRPIARYCIHPRERVPDADNVLGQLLLLEADPDLFRKTANRTAIPRVF
jgi:hypothetical protein